MITTTDIKISYTPTSATSTFSFPIPYFESTDLTVTITDSNGNESDLTLNAAKQGFTVRAVNADPNNGATITTTSSYSTGYTVTIWRTVPVTQEATFLRGGDIPPDVLNTALDRLTAAVQQVNYTNNQALATSISDSGNDLSLGTAADRAGKFILFDENGDVTLVLPVESGTVSVDDDAGLSITNNVISAKIDEATLVFDINGVIEVGEIQTANIAASAVTTAKIADSNVTYAKIQDMTGAPSGDGWVLGNMAAAQAPYEVKVDGDTSLAANSEDYLVTQKAVKAYIDAEIAATQASQVNDLEYIPLVSGTLALTQTAIAEYTYNVADFYGTGIDNDNIRSVKVSCVGYDSGGSGSWSQIDADFAGVTETVCFADTGASGASDRDRNVFDLPVNSGDTTIRIEIVSLGTGGASFTILGVTQLA